MKNIYNCIIGIVVLFFAYSCSKSFDDTLVPECEVINGFEVCWRTQITENQKAIIRGILNDMVYVEGDYFVMGATPEQEEFARSNEYPNAYIRLSDFYICKYEVSDEQYNVIMEEEKAASMSYPSSYAYDEWVRFIEVLRDMTSLDFNMPSEAQWEFSAKGGRYSRNYIYPGSNNIEDVCSTSYINGSQFPNELGLFNMADLKSEWCLDFYDSLVPGKLLYDWIQLSGEYHVVRGGNFRCTTETDCYEKKPLIYSLGYDDTDYRYCRTTSRAYGYEHEINYIGCRLVINSVLR